MTIESNLKQLQDYNIEVKGTLRHKLKAHHLNWMVEQMNDEVAKELLQILIQDRNERAKINQEQSQDITRKASKIFKLDQEVSYWKTVADNLNKAFEDFQRTAIETTDLLYQRLILDIGERSEICQALKKVSSLYREGKKNHTL